MSVLYGERRVAFQDDRPPALLLDLDGTLIDSVYQHAIAWHKALELGGIRLSVWRIHRRIGMSGGLLADSLARETGRELSEKDAAKLKRAHARLFAAQVRDVRPLPGALDLVRHLTRCAWHGPSRPAARWRGARPLLTLVNIPPGVPVITRDDVAHANPIPRPLDRGRRPARRADRIGDCRGRQRVGPARRAAGARTRVGLLSGGYGQTSWSAQGPTGSMKTRPDLLLHIDELGIRAE